MEISGSLDCQLAYGLVCLNGVPMRPAQKLRSPHGLAQVSDIERYHKIEIEICEQWVLSVFYTYLGKIPALTAAVDLETPLSIGKIEQNHSYL